MNSLWVMLSVTEWVFLVAPLRSPWALDTNKGKKIHGRDSSPPKARKHESEGCGFESRCGLKHSSLNMCYSKLVRSPCCDLCAINIWEMYIVMFFSCGRCTPNVNKNNKIDLLIDFLIVKQTNWNHRAKADYIFLFILFEKRAFQLR